MVAVTMTIILKLLNQKRRRIMNNFCIGIQNKCSSLGLVSGILKDQRGVIMIMFALLLPILVGVIGLGVEVGSWYYAKRNLQSAADGAAVAALFEVRSGSDADTILDKAKEEATANGWDETAGDTLTAVSPPTSGSFVDDTLAVEVNVTKSIDLLFASIFLSNAVTANSRAVARLQASSEACILALNDSADEALNFSGNTSVTLTGCAIAANSSSDTAIDGNGNFDVTADCASTVGNTELESPDLTLTDCTSTVTGALAIDDPYEDLPSPTIDASCLEDGFTNQNGNVTVSPGRYCNGFGANGGTITFESGTYVIDEGDFNVNGNATIVEEAGGTGVTIILTDSSGGDDPGRINNINGGAEITLSAPTTGDYAGVLFYQEKTAQSSDTNVINGGADITLQGAIYFPKENVTITGNSSLSAGCIQIIADTVSFSGDATLQNNCDSAGTSPITINQGIGLVE
jgi:hypothetical protein